MTIHIDFFSAGDGSGKTFRITQQLKEELKNGLVHPSGVIATTFTRLAASELRERVREALMSAGQISLANQMNQTLINTVNGVCGELLQRFSFEAGYSPELQVLDESQAEHLFAEAVDRVVGDGLATLHTLNSLSFRLGFDDKGVPAWRKDIEEIVKAARSNNCSVIDMHDFAHRSTEELLSYFRAPTAEDLDARLNEAIEYALEEIGSSGDNTKTTASYAQFLRDTQRRAKAQRLTWVDWIALSKKSGAKKSAEAAAAVQSVAESFETHPRLHDDISTYTARIFELAARALEKYQQLKAKQGLIDFVDQELQLYRLLENEVVRQTLADEIQLLMVDEFQDTSPIQLALFTRLAELADKVVWVGDIKQAIYGFRGSDPELMYAVVDEVERNGGNTEVLGKSWRSRPALVKYCNSLFSRGFSNTLEADRVTLEPAREEILPDEPAVIQLQISGNVDAQLASIASAVRGLVDSG